MEGGWCWETVVNLLKAFVTVKRAKGVGKGRPVSSLLNCRSPLEGGDDTEEETTKDGLLMLFIVLLFSVWWLFFQRALFERKVLVAVYSSIKLLLLFQFLMRGSIPYTITFLLPQSLSSLSPTLSFLTVELDFHANYDLGLKDGFYANELLFLFFIGQSPSNQSECNYYRHVSVCC